MRHKKNPKTESLNNILWIFRGFSHYCRGFSHYCRGVSRYFQGVGHYCHVKLVSEQVSRNLGPSCQPGVRNDTKLIVIVSVWLAKVLLRVLFSCRCLGAGLPELCESFNSREQKTWSNAPPINQQVCQCLIRTKTPFTSADISRD